MCRPRCCSSLSRLESELFPRREFRGEGGGNISLEGGNTWVGGGGMFPLLLTPPPPADAPGMNGENIIQNFFCFILSKVEPEPEAGARLKNISSD